MESSRLKCGAECGVPEVPQVRGDGPEATNKTTTSGPVIPPTTWGLLRRFASP